MLAVGKPRYLWHDLCLAKHFVCAGWSLLPGLATAAEAAQTGLMFLLE